MLYHCSSNLMLPNVVLADMAWFQLCLSKRGLCFYRSSFCLPKVVPAQFLSTQSSPVQFKSEPTQSCTCVLPTCIHVYCSLLQTLHIIFLLVNNVLVYNDQHVSVSVADFVLRKTWYTKQTELRFDNVIISIIMNTCKLLQIVLTFNTISLLRFMYTLYSSSKVHC